jgi:hypothetical protein
MTTLAGQCEHAQECCIDSFFFFGKVTEKTQTAKRILPLKKRPLSPCTVMQFPSDPLHTIASSMQDSFSVISVDSGYDEAHQSSVCHVPIWHIETNCDEACDNSSVSSSASEFQDFFTSGLSDNDVLCGRGKGANNATGNRRLRELVVLMRPAYIAAQKRKDKREICERIISIIHSRGGRFLDKDNSEACSWEILPMDKILIKISQALRETAKISARKVAREKKQQERAARKSIQHVGDSIDHPVPAVILDSITYIAHRL